MFLFVIRCIELHRFTAECHIKFQIVRPNFRPRTPTFTHILIHCKLDIASKTLAFSYTGLLLEPRCTTTVQSRAFSCYGPRIWNHLSQKVRLANFYLSSIVMTHYLSLASHDPDKNTSAPQSQVN